MAAAISARGLTRTFRLGDRPVAALRDVSLDIEAGAFIALCGPSGSGKSTLLHILAGLDAPDAGEVFFAGRPGCGRLGADVGFVFQSFNLIPVLSALENVEMPLWPRRLPTAERRRLATDMLDRVGLADRAHHRPAALSGGQQQRVAVARALVGGPAVVFADEPTANLDGRTAEDILALMRSLNAALGTTFVFSTHDARVMGYADRRIDLEDGVLVNQKVAA